LLFEHPARTSQADIDYTTLEPSRCFWPLCCIVLLENLLAQIVPKPGKQMTTVENIYKSVSCARHQVLETGDVQSGNNCHGGRNNHVIAADVAVASLGFTANI
jgi:hypothetical protein